MTYIQLYIYLIENYCKSYSMNFTAGEVRRQLNMPKSTFNYYMKNLIEEQLVIRKSRGRYIICNATWFKYVHNRVASNPRMFE